jgi:adenosylmethionine-8-amino-7-oxononanoate aminotransferase
MVHFSVHEKRRMSGNTRENKGLGGAEPDWYAAGLDHIWLPYTQMKTVTPPLAVTATHGSRIVLANGHELIDGIASWWTACHGYSHPHIRAAVERQLGEMPHIMFGGMVHEPALTLARRLTALLGHGLDRVFFSDSGSVAVEVALKMAVQYWLNKGVRGRTRIVAFNGGYHGDTTGAMAVSDPASGFHAAFHGLLPSQIMLDLPVDEASTAALEKILGQRAGEIAAVIVEPLVQGAGGMRFRNAGALKTLRTLADRYEVLLIFDEVFTGFLRTGAMFAFQDAGVVPDIITLSKALTGGTLPLAATVARKKIFDAFWSDDPKNALMHGPTFMANPLACAAANASFDLFEREPRRDQVAKIETALRQGLEPCRELPGVVDVRVKGAIGVVELDRIENLNALRQRFIAEGVFIRPFGNVIYLTPAFVISEGELAKLTAAIRVVLGELRLGDR